MQKKDIRCSKRDCLYCCIPDCYRSNPDVLGTCECPAMVIETDIFTGQCLNFKSAENSEEQEREINLRLEKIRDARQAITEHMQGKTGTGQINCPVCQTGKLAFAVCDNGHIHARCSTEHCMAWME